MHMTQRALANISAGRLDPEGSGVPRSCHAGAAVR